MANDIETKVAKALWHWFGNPHVVEWEDETHRDEYLLAATHVLQIIGAQKDVAFRSEAFHAAERTNKRFGQWMPQQWLEIFVGEMMKEPA